MVQLSIPENNISIDYKFWVFNSGKKISDPTDKTEISEISEFFILFICLIYFLKEKKIKIQFRLVNKVSDPTDKTEISGMSQNFNRYF